jgi:hypothetical protein
VTNSPEEAATPATSSENGFNLKTTQGHLLDSTKGVADAVELSSWKKNAAQPLVHAPFRFITSFF